MSATPAPAATYTTSPISGDAVISRSTQNLSTTLRDRRNAYYSSVNYAIISNSCIALSLAKSPIAQIVIGFVFFLWLTFHFFQKDPLLIWGYHVNDWAVFLSLVFLPIQVFWIKVPLSILSIVFGVGSGVGMLISLIQGVLRNRKGLFLDENDAVSDG